MPLVGCRELGMIIKLPPDKVVPNDDFITDRLFMLINLYSCAVFLSATLTEALLPCTKYGR